MGRSFGGVSLGGDGGEGGGAYVGIGYEEALVSEVFLGILNRRVFGVREREDGC